jgi:hypothetical protein
MPWECLLEPWDSMSDKDSSSASDNNNDTDNDEVDENPNLDFQLLLSLLLCMVFVSHHIIMWKQSFSNLNGQRPHPTVLYHI